MTSVLIRSVAWALLALPACATPVPTRLLAPARAESVTEAAVRPERGSASICVPVDAPYVGTLCAPGGHARRPAIAFFGGYGGDGEARRLALEFSGRGYVTAAVSYFSVTGTPRTLVDVPVEIGVAAVTALSGRDDVDSTRVTVMGTSKGGEYALLVAATTPMVKAVIANVPSPFAWYGLGPRGVPSGCSWAREGRALPCVPEDAKAGQEVWQAMRAGRPVAFRAAYEAAGRNEAAVEHAFFPLERVAGPILCLAAGDDQVWNSAAHCELAMAYLRAHHHPFADRAVSYPGAGHLYLLARAGSGAALNSAPMGGGGRMAFGGTPEADVSAAQSALATITAFLESGARFRHIGPDR
jgi:dienelactone hydrolase